MGLWLSNAATSWNTSIARSGPRGSTRGPPRSSARSSPATCFGGTMHAEVALLTGAVGQLRLSRYRDAHQLDLGGRVEQAADLEQGHGRVVPAEMTPVRFTDFLR